MANDDHVELVRKGHKAIESWRKAHASEHLDLREADLEAVDMAQADLRDADLSLANLDGVNLSGSNLVHVNLRGASLVDASLISANLKEADLSLVAAREADLGMANLGNALLIRADLAVCNLQVAYLCGANLTETILERATLKDADLRNADLVRTDLTGADLSGADLSEARLDRVLLHGADLNGARCGATRFSDLDLSHVKGLGTIHHTMPSSVGADTLYRSVRHLSKRFLEGCGLQPNLVAFLLSLAKDSDAASDYSCFISYCDEDGDFARKLATRMRKENPRVWEASESTAAWKTPGQLEGALATFDRWLLIVSDHAMNSHWVLAELRKARQAERNGPGKLHVIALADSKSVSKWLPAERTDDRASQERSFLVTDFSGWKLSESFDRAYSLLMERLRREDPRQED
jgi:uncharacterized protein YjbI with pentapeptide repeats